MSLSDIAIRRPVFTLVVMIGLMVLGVMSLRSLGTDLFPDVTFPVVTITTVYPGAAPGEVESQVSRPLEDAVAGINDLDTVRSFSRESVSVVIVMFKLKADIDKAAQDVRERVSGARPNLPQQVREPSIRRVDVGAAPIRTYVVTGAMSHEALRRVTEDTIKPALERVPGVAAIEVVGGRDREVRVEVNRKRLDALTLPLTAVIDRLRAENISVPAGHFEQGQQEVSVRLAGDLHTAADVGRIVIATSPSGTQIPLSDIADVRDDFAETRTRIRANGQEAVAFEVLKQSGTNTIAVSDAVGRRLADLKPTLPGDFRTSLIVDQSTFIRENAHELEISIIYGGLMAILVILLFMLDLRSTFISALALPTSVMGTFFVMDLLGFTLNMMTLLALSLAIGLLIDDAVVVRENIFRHLEKGEDPYTAASRGTSEIALAVFATTLTIVAVFVPVAFMGGVVGQFFRQFGLTISAAVMLSLFVAFTLDPMLSARLATKIDHGRRRAWPVRMIETVHATIDELYSAILTVSVRFKFLTVLIGAATFGGSLLLAGLMGSDFVSPEDRGQFIVDIELPPGLSLEETTRRTLAAEKKLLENKDIITLFSKLGPGGEVNKVQWRVVCTPKNERTAKLLDLQKSARAALELVPEAKVSVTPPGFVEGLPAGAPLQVQVRGSNLDLLERDASRIEAMMRAIPGLGDVNVNYAPGKPEQTVRVDRQKAADLGVPVAAVARTLRAALEGEEAGQLRLADGARKEVRIRVRLRDEDRGSLQGLGRLTVTTPDGPVPLSDLAVIEPQSGPQVIERQERTRQIVVTGVPTTRSLGEILEDLEPQLAAYKWEGDGHFRLDGQVKQMKETSESMGMALLLGVIFIYLILAAQFESFLHPMTIMLSLPLAFVGAFVALFLAGHSMSMGSNIGIILLMGLVTKNGILLVDAALQHQREGMTALASVLDAGRKRLRPILMTSAAMILGMLPTAMDNGPGSEFRSPMALAVIGGVVTSTLLTLVVLPSVFLWADHLRGVVGRLRRSKPVPVAVPGPVAETTVLIALVAATLLAGLFLQPVEARAQEPLTMQVRDPAQVSPPQPVGDALTLEAAVTRALVFNLDLAVTQARLAEAVAARAKVGTAWLPDAKAVGTYTHNSDEAKFDFSEIGKKFGLKESDLPPPTIIQKRDTLSAVLTVDQTVFALSPVLLARAADQGVAAQRTGVQAAQREVAFRVAEAFYAVAGLDRLQAAAERAVTLADQRIAMAQRRHKEGAEGELPLLRAQVERSRAEQDLARARHGRLQLLETVGMLLGQAAPSALVQPPPVELPQGNPVRWIEMALADRPELLARRQAILAAQSLLREAELRWAPLLTLGAFLRWSDTAGFTGEHWLWATSANLVVPLFDRGQRLVDVQERRRALQRMDAELRKTENDLRTQVQLAALEVQAARQGLAVAQTQAGLARRSAEIVTRAQAAGALTSLDVAEADTSLRQSEANEARERIQLDIAVLRLRHLTGSARP